jgi:uncharacterized membrane protein HdeD (DUF308 family)
MSHSARSAQPAAGQSAADHAAEARAETAGQGGPFARMWWLYLVAGVLWLLFGMFILTLRPAAVASVAILAGVAFILGGISQFFMAMRAENWRWLWFVGGILGIAAGIAAFVWPAMTLYVLAVFVAWYLVISGVFVIIAALSGPTRHLWWVGLIIGALEFLLGIWAIASPGRELLLLVNLVGISMVLYGVTEIFAAFGIRTMTREMASAGRETVPSPRRPEDEGRAAPREQQRARSVQREFEGQDRQSDQ